MAGFPTSTQRREDFTFGRAVPFGHIEFGHRRIMEDVDAD